MFFPSPFGGTVSFTGYLRVYAGEPSADDALHIKYPPTGVCEAAGLRATWADAVDIQWDAANWGFAPIGRFTVDVPPGFQHVRFGTKRQAALCRSMCSSRPERPRENAKTVWRLYGLRT